MMKPFAAAIAMAALAVPAFGQDMSSAKAEFIDANGESIGTAALTDTGKGVLIDAEISGLPSGQWVAFHVHETGECAAGEAFDSAGGHFNPADAEHGFKVENGPHAGDMPNQYVGADGTLRAQVYNTSITLGEEENGVSGRALMIHGGADDYESQPSGDAGDRLACAVIE